MLIKREKVAGYEYSLTFKFEHKMVEYLKYLKDKYGFRRFSFCDGAWRFTEIDFAIEIKARFPEVVIDSEILLEYELAEYMAKEAIFAKANADRLKKSKESTLEIKGIKGELFGYQKIGVEFFINSNGRAMNSDPMGCLSGDTIIQVNRRGNCRKYTLEKAHEGFNKLSHHGGYGWRYPAYTRSYDEKKKEFFLNKIEKIIYSGVKNTLILEAKSSNKKYKLNLTSNHEVMTPRGWVAAGKLKKGDKIITNGKLIKYCKTCKEKTEHSQSKMSKFYGLCKKCIYRFFRENHCNKNHEKKDKDGYVLVGGLFFHPNNKTSGTTGVRKHILVYEAFENKVSYERWIEMGRTNSFTKNLKFIDSKIYSIHHKDGIKENNNIDNLEKLLVREHLKKEGRIGGYKNFKETFLPDEAIITSIKKGKKQKVYDLVMADPHRSFLANGVVVHNSGKSLQALAYTAHAGLKKVLVLCPAVTKYNWRNEVSKWTYLKPFVIDSDMSEEDVSLKIQKSEVVIINYDILKKFSEILKAVPFEIGILDECHYLKNRSATRSKYAKALVKRFPKIILLSGTPFLNRPIELFNPLNILDSKNWFDYYAYARRYCEGHMGRFGWDDKGASNIAELQERISPYFIRRSKQEILPDLPKKRFIDYPVQLDTETQRKYDMAEEEFGKFLIDIKKKTQAQAAKSLQAEKLVKLGALRQLASVGKIEISKEIIENIIENGEKVVVFSCYNSPIEELHKYFKDKSVLVTGKIGAEKRNDIVTEFQNNKDIKIFFGGIKSAGVGINLTAATNVLFVDYSWVPGDHSQAIDRIHRIGSTAKHIVIYQLYSKKTVDEYMYKLLKKKQLLFDQLIDGAEIPDAMKKSYTTSIINAIERKEKRKNVK